MTPFGPFYCVFKSDLSRLEDSNFKTSETVVVRHAKESEMLSVAEVWLKGLAVEMGNPWADYLKRWTPGGAAKWFLDSHKRLGARFLVAEVNGKIVGVSGVLLEKKSGVGRMFTGVVVSPEERRKEVGSVLLYRTLLECKSEGLRRAQVETIAGIIASKHLYPKFGGIEQRVPAEPSVAVEDRSLQF